MEIEYVNVNSKVKYYENINNKTYNQHNITTQNNLKEDLVNKNEEKTKILIKKIIEDREIAIKIIIIFLKKINNINNEKKEIILKKLVKERKIFMILIQKQIKYHLIRKKVKDLIDKEKDNFCILCNIKNAKIVKLHVHLENKPIRVFYFTYCDIRKIFVLYISRELAQGNSFKVNFIADEKIVIDPKYRTDYDEKGNFYNIIDFEKIEEAENKFECEKQRIIKFFLNYINKQREIEDNYFKRDENDKLDLSSSDEDNNLSLPNKHTSENNCHKSAESFSQNRRNSSLRKSFQGRETNLLSRSIMNMKGQLRLTATFNNLRCPVKPILRSPNQSKSGMGNKKVSFGTVQFSF